MVFISKYKDIIDFIPFGKYKGSPLSVLFDDLVYAREIISDDKINNEYPELCNILKNYFKLVDKEKSKKITLSINEKNVLDMFLKKNIEKKNDEKISIDTMLNAINSWITLNNYSKISKKKIITYLNKKLLANLDEKKKQIGWNCVKLNFNV